MEVILLERVGRLGNIGDVVKVRPGYARNFLIPQQKALRASEESKAEFEKRKETIAAENAKNRSKAEQAAKKLEGFTLSLVRQASEDGKLYGSVTSRDVAAELTAAGHAVERSMVALSATIKNIGSYPVTVQLHPEVTVKVNVSIVRNETDVIDNAAVPAELTAAETPAEEAQDQQA